MSGKGMSTTVTYSARCARSLLRVLERHEPKRTLLFSFAPSPTTSPETVSHIATTLTQLYPEHVGCISAPLPRTRDGPHLCSLACAFVNGVSFRSTVPGRAEVHVGRWHTTRERGSEDSLSATRVKDENAQIRILGEHFKHNGKVDWEHVWDCRSTPSLSPKHRVLPDELLTADSSAVDNIFYFSDRAPEGLESVLQNAFPQANKLSLVASSTPFITGRPVTLFYNGSVFSDGAVGIAFTSSALSSPGVTELSLPPLVVLSRDLKVTSSKGNLILSLDFRNPTQLLLSAIQERDPTSSHTTLGSKEDEFYVGVVDPSSQQISQLYRINAGDPSRGSVALDAASAPKEGSIVRLCHLSKETGLGTSTYVGDTVSNSISLFVTPEMTPTAGFGDEIPSDDDQVTIENAFLAASENGFTLSRRSQGSWRCVVPGARVALPL